MLLLLLVVAAMVFFASQITTTYRLTYVPDVRRCVVAFPLAHLVPDFDVPFLKSLNILEGSRVSPFVDGQYNLLTYCKLDYLSYLSWLIFP